jgi:poly(3-hydroxybutyrate) depolymerase
MKRIAILFSLCTLALLCALPAQAKDKDKVQVIHFDFNGKQREYLVLIPSSAAPTAPLPTVLLLHWQGGHDSDVMGAWKGKASHEGFIVIAPESTSNNMWDSKVDGPNFLRAVMLDVNGKHPIDPTKVFIFGDDTGGIYGYEMALIDSQNWGAACAEHAVVPSDVYQFFPHVQRKVAFQDWVGDNDQDHPLRVMDAEHDAFTQAGFPFDVKIIQNSSGSYGGAVMDQVNDGCYNFFMKHPLPAPGAAYLATAGSAAPAAAPATPPSK